MAQAIAEVQNSAPSVERPAPSRPPGRLGRLLPYALLVGLPFLLLALDPNWCYSPVGGLDPWLYQGFFRFLPHYQRTLFPGTYYGSRLSWVLPAHLAYRAFPPYAANLVIHMTVALVSLLSFYFVASRTISRRAALVGAVLLGANAVALSSFGDDYVAGGGVAYYLLSLAFLTAAATSGRRPLWLMLAGGAAAALVWTNLVWVPLTPLLGVYYVFARYRLSDRPGTLFRALVESALGLTAGAALLTAALGAANIRLGGRFYFFMPQVQMLFALTGSKNAWLIPMRDWLPRAFWLSWPALGLFCAALFHATRVWRREGLLGPGLRGWWPLNGALMCGLFFVAQLRGQPVLQLDYYAVYLLPAAVLAACALLRDPLARLRPAQFAVTAAVLYVVALACHKIYYSPLAFTGTLAACAAGLGVAHFFARLRPAVVAGVLLLGAMSVVSPTGTPFVTPQGRYSARLLNKADHFARLSRGVDAVTSVIGRARPRFWYDKEEICRYDSTSLSSIWLWGFALVNEDFPNLAPDWKSPLQPGEFVIVLSQRDGAYELAEDAMSRRGIRLRPAGSRDVETEGGSYTLTFAEVVSVPH